MTHVSPNFSPIQNHILKTLKNAESLRYSELQPEDRVPNDLFNYHLQFLVKKEYVDKLDDGYALAQKGVKHVADPYTYDDLKEIASLYKVNVITILSREKDGKIEILNQLRQSHPSFGKVGVMGGIVRKGETTEEAATRKLQTETGLTAEFKVVGMERRMMYEDGELFSDILFPIAYADAYEGELQNTDFGENMWVPLSEAIKNDTHEHDWIESIVRVLKEIKKGSINEMPFFYNEVERR